MGSLSNTAMIGSLRRFRAAVGLWVVLMAMLACEAVAQQPAIGGHSDCFANVPRQVQRAQRPPQPTTQPTTQPTPAFLLGTLRSGDRHAVPGASRQSPSIEIDDDRQPATIKRSSVRAHGRNLLPPSSAAQDRIDSQAAPVGPAGYLAVDRSARAITNGGPAICNPVSGEAAGGTGGLPASVHGPARQARVDKPPVPPVDGLDASSCCRPSCPHIFQFLPDGLMYPTYVAGAKEPRFASVWIHETDRGWIWETALGGRVGVYRYGTPGAQRPQGWQLDFEGAVFPRLDWEVHSDLEAADFRVGVPITWRRGATAVKFGYYHISAHVGDEFLERNPGFQRRNYVRDALLLGVMRNLSDDLVVYGEVAVAPSPSGGAEPWEIQIGTEYSPVKHCHYRGVPFAAVNGHLREEFDFGGSVNIVAGWQWWGDVSDCRIRTGLQYYRGKSMQYSFFDKHEELLGMGMWFDF